MDPQESYSEQVYEILRDFLPQIQREIRDQLQTKYRKNYEDKLQSQLKRIEQQMSRRHHEQVIKAIKEKEAQIKNDYEKILEAKIKEIEHTNEQALRRFKNEVMERKGEENKEQQIAVLLQQKANWERQERDYQMALRELKLTNEKKNVPRPSSKDKVPVSGYQQKTFTKVSNPITMKIDIPRERKLDIQADMGSELFRKDDNTSDYSSLLSPPHIEMEELEKKKQPQYTKDGSNSEKKKSLFWNEDKKKELLDMIRKRIM